MGKTPKPTKHGQNTEKRKNWASVWVVSYLVKKRVAVVGLYFGVFHSFSFVVPSTLPDWDGRWDCPFLLFIFSVDGLSRPDEVGIHTVSFNVNVSVAVSVSVQSVRRSCILCGWPSFNLQTPFYLIDSNLHKRTTAEPMEGHCLHNHIITWVLVGLFFSLFVLDFSFWRSRWRLDFVQLIQVECECVWECEWIRWNGNVSPVCLK
jgi:hypothetical protein